MKVYVDLTDNEERALLSALLYASRACQATCVYEEMKTKSTDCINCPYEKGIYSLRRKFSKPKSLADYTKQVRKEVVDNVYAVLEQAVPHDLCWSWAVIKKELDQIQGETK